MRLVTSEIRDIALLRAAAESLSALIILSPNNQQLLFELTESWWARRFYELLTSKTFMFFVEDCHHMPSMCFANYILTTGNILISPWFGSQKLFTGLLPTAGDFTVQATIMEVFYRYAASACSASFRKCSRNYTLLHKHHLGYPSLLLQVIEKVSRCSRQVLQKQISTVREAKYDQETEARHVKRHATSCQSTEWISWSTEEVIRYLHNFRNFEFAFKTVSWREW